MQRLIGPGGNICQFIRCRAEYKYQKYTRDKAGMPRREKYQKGKTMNSYVAKMIVLAQIASDSGKNIEELKVRNESANHSAVVMSYSGKDHFIKNAVCAILRDHESGFTFCVSDGQGVSPNLVYFNFKLNGCRKQISFHSFDPWLEKFKKNGLKCITRWDKGSSRNTARELAESIGF